MWTPENIAALATGIAGIIGAVTVLIRQLQHVRNPGAHAGAPGSAAASLDPGGSPTPR